ncbi:MAG TPA: DNA translocase FtsK 4TM domain-containing protein [Xanthobacteraceae bacterium]|nr:DNA translocase FtsK 4TM domain-containing protein [Xanthobacteraceae bacterium]
MATVYRNFDMSFLPDEIAAALRRRLRETSGLVLIGSVAAVAAALATWSVNDPSLSHATSAPVRNILGTGGAIAADLLMQLLGLASIALIVPVAGWGWRLLTHRGLDREIIRVLLWFAGVALAAAFAACLPRTSHWPLPSGLGGVIGDAMLRLPAWLVGAPLSGMTRVLLAVALAVLATGALTVASGFAFSAGRENDDEEEEEVDETERTDEEEEERTSVSLGWLVHGLLSLKARFARLIMLPFRRSAGKSKAPGRAVQRVEPRFDTATDADMAEIEEDEEEEEEHEEEPPAKAARGVKSRATKPAQRKTSDGFVLPALNLLAAVKATAAKLSEDTIQANAAALEHVLEDFGVRGEIINARPGPVVTLYELEPAPGIKSSRVIGLADDIARSMSAVSARVAVVSGRNAIGIELPNPTREKVFLREILNAVDEHGATCKLPLCLGKTIGGEPVIADLARMPHLLIAGTTGSGKSVAINTMILSLVYRLRPDQCRLIMVDPKMLELSVYDGIPHLLTPVVTDPKKAVVALKWAVREMEDRYKKMAKLGVRNIDGYNTRLAEAREKGERLTRTVHTGYDRETGEAIYEKEALEFEPLPYVVVIVDEMADLMMVAGKDIEGAIQRLAQMARAAGIHVILATQRPSVDVITGTIKANFPTRISFQVTSKIDSRTILGEQGAEQLLGQGDMLYMAGGGRISRVHGPFVSDEEVEKVVRHLKSQGVPQYLEEVTAGDGEDEDGNPIFDATGMGQTGDATDLYQQAVQIVMRDQKASTSYIQRRLQIGYNRAASIMERMEQEGVVGPANHAGKREILLGAEARE